MWTTYSQYVYMEEEQMKMDIDSLEKENAVSDQEWGIKVKHDIENGLIDDPLPWEEEDEYVKGILQRDGIYSVPLGDELETLIREVYKEAK